MTRPEGEPCRRCDMSGFVKCGECNGRGRKEYNPATGPTKCMKCKGAGQIKCPTCRGEGFR